MSKVKPELTAEEKKRANGLCVISLILGFAVTLILGAISLFLDNNGMETLSAYVLFPASASFLAGLVLMIIVRIKYSRSLFGKILMVIYIVFIAAAVVGTAYLLISCLTACSDPRW